MSLSFLDVLLLTGLLFIGGITLVLLRNRVHFRRLRRVPEGGSGYSVGICIPARNEEQNLNRCLDHALAQRHEKTTVYVLNDRSSDATGSILEHYKRSYGEKLQILYGRTKPDSWLGKPHACAQLAARAGAQDKCDILLFADADTWLEPGTAGRTAGIFARAPIDFFTVWPEQRSGSRWERIVVPLVYYALLGLLPVMYTERKPRWMPAFFHRRYRAMFAAACGQFMAFRRDAYEAIGGHTAVRNEVVEDVMLARNVMQAGLKMRMYHGVGSVFCRMYDSEKSMFEGFRKNFLAGFDYNIPLFVSMALLHFITFILPLFVLIFAAFQPETVSLFSIWASVALLLLPILHRLLLGTWMQWPKRFAFTHILGVLWFQRLGLIALWDYLSDRDVHWKGERIGRK
ncbi:MAG: glycosyltransferase [Cyclonatronaceae bacterium]